MGIFDKSNYIFNTGIIEQFFQCTLLPVWKTFIGLCSWSITRPTGRSCQSLWRSVSRYLRAKSTRRWWRRAAVEDGRAHRRLCGLNMPDCQRNESVSNLWGSTFDNSQNDSATMNAHHNCTLFTTAASMACCSVILPPSQCSTCADLDRFKAAVLFDIEKDYSHECCELVKYGLLWRDALN